MNKKKIGKILLITYCILISYLLFFSFEYGRTSGVAIQYSKYNLHLGETIQRYYNALINGRISFLEFLKNIIGNIFIFIPLIPLLYFTGMKVLEKMRVCVLAFFLPLFIELIQYYFSLGVFDIDDILLNALGIFIGWMISLYLNKRL